MNRLTKLLNFEFSKKLPMILQSEITECGLACVAMIATYYGYQIDLLTLRRQFSVSLQGSTLKDLIEIVQKLNLTSRALKIELSDLKLLKVPCILHWDLNHFVVLKKVQGNTVIIHDPTIGVIKYKMKEVSEHFTGIAMELMPTINFEKKTNKTSLSLSDLWGSATGLKLLLIQIFLVSIALEVFQIVIPLMLQLIVDEVIVAKDYSLLYVITWGFAILILIQTITTYVRSWIVIFLANNLNIQLVANLMHHLFKLPLDYFEKRHMGDMVSRFESIATIQDKLSTDFIVAIVDGILIIVTLIVMLTYNYILTIVVIVALLLCIIIRLILYPAMKYQTQAFIIASAKEQSIFMESIRAILPLKIFTKEAQRENVWLNCYADKLNTNIRLSKLSLVYQSIMQIIFGVEYITIIFMGAKAIMANNGFSIGMLMAYLSYRQQFVDKAKNLVEKTAQYQMIKVHLERIADITLTEPEEGSKTVIPVNRIICGNIQVQNLSFRYSEQDPCIFQDINFTLQEGEILAINGSSGCGKTTLMKVLLSLLSPSHGKILVDGMDIKKIGLHTYRSNIAAVMQEDTLLSGSISDNICFFDPMPDLDRIYKCAMAAAIHENIMKMPMSYQTLIGDMGASLSGGQKQRIMLARALYSQPKILFLDEATSNLDSANENIINQNIKLMGITRIIISHRKEILNIADQIIDL
jgi:ATP-binding cassette subfamily B protein RaxB